MPPSSVLWSAFVLLLVLTPAELMPVAAQEVNPAASPAAEVAETLLRVTLDRADLPPGESGLVLLGRATAQPGRRGTVRKPDAVGTEVHFVESGTNTYQLDGPGRIFRGANTATPSEEPAPIGTPFAVHAGEALVLADRDTLTVIESNERTEPAVFLFLILQAPLMPPEPDPTATGEVSAMIFHFLPYEVHDPPLPDLPPGPVTLALRHFDLDPGASVSAPPPGVFQLVTNDTGEINGPEFEVGGEIVNGGTTTRGVFAITLAPGGTPGAAGTPEAT